jgi:hypothetical protein
MGHGLVATKRAATFYDFDEGVHWVQKKKAWACIEYRIWRLKWEKIPYGSQREVICCVFILLERFLLLSTVHFTRLGSIGGTSSTVPNGFPAKLSPMYYYG